MKAELRIGNILEYHGQSVYVLEIKRNGVEFGYFTDSVGFFREYDSKDFPKPIAIIEDWLLDFGFELFHKNNKHYCINDKNGYKDTHKISIFPTINEQWHIAFSDTLNGYKDYIPTTKVKYIHQLQNLIYALTSTELTTNKEL